MQLLPPALASCALLLGGCSLLDSSSKVALATDPPGARVEVDERDTGFVTPCVLELDPEDSCRVTMSLAGYTPARRLLVPGREVHAILWRDMYLRSGVWRMPLWLNTRDLFEPIQVDKRFSPSRIFVRLERTADR